MKKSVLVVGAGVNGLVMSILLARKGYAVRLVESSHEVGGQFKGVKINEYIFDLGLYIPQLIGELEIDEILREQDDIVLREKQQKDIAGNIFRGNLNAESLFLDLRSDSSLAHEVFYQISEKYGLNNTSTNSANEYFYNRFGQRAYESVFKGLLQNAMGHDVDDYDSAALKIFHLTRLVLFDEKASSLLKGNSYFDERIAYPSQMEIDDKFLEEKTPSFYPRKYGLYRLIASLVRQLDVLGVEVDLGVNVAKINLESKTIKSVSLNVRGVNEECEFDEIVWCANTYALDSLIGINMMPFTLVDPPIKQMVTYCIADKKPEVDNLYWLWDYDNNPVMRMSFPHNYSELPFSDGYLIVLEHGEAFKKDDVKKYFSESSIVNPSKIRKLETPSDAKRFFYRFTKKNIEIDRAFISKLESREIDNLHLCSSKVSQGIFYLHDLLSDGYKKLKKSGVI